MGVVGLLVPLLLLGAAVDGDSSSALLVDDLPLLLFDVLLLELLLVLLDFGDLSLLDGDFFSLLFLLDDESLELSLLLPLASSFSLLSFAIAPPVSSTDDDCDDFDASSSS